jgi:phenylalanyl-tRNA synthetase beta chain
MPPTHVLDVYEGPGVEAGKTSVAIEAVVRPTDRTLTDKDIEALSAKVVAGVAKATGAVSRG